MSSNSLCLNRSEATKHATFGMSHGNKSSDSRKCGIRKNFARTGNLYIPHKTLKSISEFEKEDPGRRGLVLKTSLHGGLATILAPNPRHLGLAKHRPGKKQSFPGVMFQDEEGAIFEQISPAEPPIYLGRIS